MLKKNLKSAISALFGALLILSLASCATGPNAISRMTKQVTDGAEAKSADIRAVNVLLVDQGDGSAVLVGTIVNSGEVTDSITEITANSIPAEFSVPALTQNSPAIFAGESANSSAKILGLNTRPSAHVDVTIKFKIAAPVTLEAIVRTKTDIYATVGD